MMRIYFLFIALTVINLVFFLRRNEAPSYAFSDYSSVYFPKECYYINKIVAHNDSLRFIGHFPTKIFHKSIDSENNYKKDSIASFRLLAGIHDYELTDSAGFHFSCTVSFTPHAIYESKGNSTQSHAGIVHCSLPVIHTPGFSLTDWIQKNTPGDSVSIHNWLASHHISEIESPLEKIDKLCRSLLDTLRYSFGIPPDSMDLISPYHQFILACDKKHKIWCKQAAQIYSAFANEAGIPTRLVGIMGSYDGVSMASHSVAESYVSYLQKWVMIDLSSEAWEIHSDSNHFYNTAEVAQLVKLNAISEAKKEFYFTDSTGRRKSDSLLHKNFANADRFFYLLKKRNSASLPTKIRNYISPRPAYIFYSFESHSRPITFYLRDFFLLLWLLIFLFIVVNFSFHKIF